MFKRAIANRDEPTRSAVIGYRKNHATLSKDNAPDPIQNLGIPVEDPEVSMAARREDTKISAMSSASAPAACLSLQSLFMRTWAFVSERSTRGVASSAVSWAL